MDRASGTFEVNLTPQNDGENAAVGRMTIAKQFQGDLNGTSKGQMLMAGTAVEGSAGYVAIEKVDGSLGGRSGSFYLQHSGTMTRGAGVLIVTVIPDSGTGELTGLSGKMNINIDSGKHSYEFDYEFA
jgi:flagellar basal body rod protein FlgG